MKLSFTPKKGAIFIGITGLVILCLNLYIQTRPLFYYADNAKETFNKTLTVYGLIGLQTLLILVVFATLSYLAYKVLNNFFIANTSLKLSENKFRAIFEKAPLGIALTDPNVGIIYEANTLYLETLGLTKKDINTSNWMKTTHPDDLEESLTLSNLLKNNRKNSFKQSKRYIHEDGSIVWADLTVSSIEIDKGTAPFRLAILENVTEQKKMEQELSDSQKKLEDAQKLAKIGSWEFDLQTRESRWTDEMFRIFEFDKTNNKDLADLYIKACNKEEVRYIERVISKSIETGNNFTYEHQINCKNEKIKNLVCIGEIVKDKKGKVIGLRGTEQDVTELKRMQGLLKSEEQNALLSRFAAQVPGALYQFRFYKDGRFEFPFVSEGSIKLCGYSPEEIKENVMNVFNLIHPDEFESLLFSVQQSMEKLEFWLHDFRIVIPEKGIKWIRGNAKPEMLEDESVIWHGYFNDISESKQTEETLKISKSKLEAVFNGSNDAIMLLNRERFFDCNAQTIEMFGLNNRFEFVECHPSDLSPQQQPDGTNSFIKANEMIEKAFNEGVNKFEWLHKRKTGETFPVEVLLSAFNYGNERVLQATVRDITKRKLTEKKILENEVLLTTILQTLPVAVFTKTINKNFSFSIWNHKAEEIFGISSKDCIGKTDYDLFPQKDADWYRQNDILACQSNGIVEIKEEIAKSAIKKIIVRTQKTVIKNNIGEPVFLLGVSEDITEQKKAEQELKTSEEKYRSVVENAADIIVTTNTKGDVEFINHNQYGELNRDIIGKSMLSFVPAEYHELVKQKLKLIIEKQVPQNFEIKGTHSDGTSAWYSINAGPIFFDKKVVGVTLINRNITERKLAENKLKQSLKEKEILLQEVHHRVKNNLQIILSILNLQQNAIEDIAMLTFIKEIQNRIKAMSFIHELLYRANDFSKINFSDYINNITNNLIYSYSQKQLVNLKQDIEPVILDLDRAIPCGLIINELITNSLKYAFKNGLGGEVSISLKQNDGIILLKIEDNGIGFPNNLNFRDTKTLGMQLVIALTEQIGGNITLDNSNGTAFTIKFKN